MIGILNIASNGSSLPDYLRGGNLFPTLLFPDRKPASLHEACLPIENPPRSISELWYQIDKRLMAIELAQASYPTSQSCFMEELSDHDTRLWSISSVSGLFARADRLLAIIALIKSILG
jgi:hypothetical protein